MYRWLLLYMGSSALPALSQLYSCEPGLPRGEILLHPRLYTKTKTTNMYILKLELKTKKCHEVMVM